MHLITFGVTFYGGVRNSSSRYGIDSYAKVFGVV